MAGARGCGVGPGDFVITTAFSFFASASAIARAGARPVLLDVDSETLNLNPGLIKTEAATWRINKIRAILPVHLYGQCADMNALQPIADEFKLPIIEDAAQAIGAKWNGKSAGSLGVAAAFSFYPTKNLSAYGDAGLVTTLDPDFAEHMRRLRNHGSSRRYYHEEFGWNARMDGIQAAVLRVKMRHIDRWNERRRRIASTYDQLIDEAGLVSAKQCGANSARCLFLSKRTTFSISMSCAQIGATIREVFLPTKIGTEVYYPFRCTCRSVLSIWDIAKAIYPSPSAPPKKYWHCRSFPNSPKPSKSTWWKPSQIFTGKLTCVFVF